MIDPTQHHHAIAVLIQLVESVVPAYRESFFLEKEKRKKKKKKSRLRLLSLPTSYFAHQAFVDLVCKRCMAKWSLRERYSATTSRQSTTSTFANSTSFDIKQCVRNVPVIDPMS
jgi:hypothetical protein